MSFHRFQRIMAVGLTLVLAGAVAAGCGKSGDDDKAKSDSDSSKPEGPRVGLVTDIGGLGDKGFNFLANKGFEQAEDELGATGGVIESK